MIFFFAFIAPQVLSAQGAILIKFAQNEQAYLKQQSKLTIICAILIKVRAALIFPIISSKN